MKLIPCLKGRPRNQEKEKRRMKIKPQNQLKN